MTSVEKLEGLKNGGSIELELSNLSAGYGALHIVDRVALRVEAGEISALLGRNGAGKTTTLKAIMGLATVQSGTISVCGSFINNRSTYEIAEAGVVYVPEGGGIFDRLTVYENLILGGLAGKKRGEEVIGMDDIYSLIPLLYERQDQAAGTLSGGEKQLLAMARALLQKPKLLLLDEVSEGLQPSYVELVAEMVTMLCRRLGVPILLVEQKSELALKLANQVYIMEKGRIVYEGATKDVKGSDLLRDHLGF